MALYLMLSKLTEKGRVRVKSHPERIREVNAEVEARGFKIVSQYALLGDYDFATVLNVPDNWNMTRLAMDLGARGTIETTTYPALQSEEFIRFMKSGDEERKWTEHEEFRERPPEHRPHDVQAGPQAGVGVPGRD